MNRGQEKSGSERELPGLTFGASILMILFWFSIYLAVYPAVSDEWGISTNQERVWYNMEKLLRLL